MEERPKTHGLCMASFILGLLPLAYVVGLLVAFGGGGGDLELLDWADLLPIPYTLAAAGLTSGLVSIVQGAEAGGERRDRILAIAGTSMSAGCGWTYLLGVAGIMAAYGGPIFFLLTAAVVLGGIVFGAFKLPQLFGRGAKMWAKVLVVGGLVLAALLGWCASYFIMGLAATG